MLKSEPRWRGVSLIRKRVALALATTMNVNVNSIFSVVFCLSLAYCLFELVRTVGIFIHPGSVKPELHVFLFQLAVHPFPSPLNMSDQILNSISSYLN